METTLETPQPEKRILIFSNDAEIKRLTGDAQRRADVLNDLARYGLTDLDQVVRISRTDDSINNHLRNEAIARKAVLKELFAAGATFEVAIPQDLQQLGYLLKAWRNLPRERRDESPTKDIAHDGNTWRVDEASLEDESIRKKLKIYLEDDKMIEEYKFLESLVAYMEEKRCPNNLVVNCHFLNLRFEPAGESRFRIRHQYFKDIS